LLVPPYFSTEIAKYTLKMANPATPRERRPSTSAPIDLQGPVGPAGISRPKHKRTFTGFGAGEIKIVEGTVYFIILFHRSAAYKQLAHGMTNLIPSQQLRFRNHSVLRGRNTRRMASVTRKTLRRRSSAMSRRHWHEVCSTATRLRHMQLLVWHSGID
jgi:hypothetical protein